MPQQTNRLNVLTQSMDALDFRKHYKKFHSWRIRRISQKNFILILSVCLGIFSGFLAVALKNSTHFIGEYLQSLNTDRWLDWAYIIFPILGIFLSYLLIRLFFKSRPELGISAILESITKTNGFMKTSTLFSSFFGSVLTVGFGGSVGLEAPAAHSASVFSSNLSRFFHLNYKTRMLMIGCAATATLSAIFNAPIAALVFALEVFMLDLTTASIVPLLLSSASASITSYFISSPELSFRYQLQDAFNLSDLPIILLLGIVAGLFSAFFNRLYFFVQQQFDKLKKYRYKMLVGALVLSVMIFLFPVLFGEGFDAINAMLSGETIKLSIFQTENKSVFLLLIACVIFLKAMACCVTVQAGGVGGIFAPSLFMGASLGYFFSESLRFFGLETTNGQLSLLGMSALVSGMLHAPLTGIFLIAELTGGYQLFVPLMLSSAIAYLISKYVERHSIYTKILETKGEHLSHNKDKSVINRLKINKLIEKDFLPAHLNMTLGQLVDIVRLSKRNIFPVLDDNKHIVGVILLDDIRQIMFDKEQYERIQVSDLMNPAQAQLDVSCHMEEVIDCFNKTGVWNIAITHSGVYLGFVSRSKLFNAYRRKLVEFSDE
ncbi:MAG: chloride channel protein [Flavobacteriales bacterium]